MKKPLYSENLPAMRRTWISCPYCGAKHSLHDNKAECHGVYVKCGRGCGKEFEIKIENGKQVR